MGKTCTSCCLEKTIEEFHRRRAGYQNICKSCRSNKARASSADLRTQGRKNKREMEKPTPEQVGEMGKRIVSLEGKIKSACGRYAGRDTITTEDLFQDACLSILNTPAETSDSMLLGKARFVALNQLDKNITYNLYTEGLEPDDEVAMYSAHSLEDEILKKESFSEIERALNTLDPKNREILWMISSDCSHAKISKELKIPKSKLSSQIEIIKKEMAAAIGGDLSALGFIANRQVVRNCLED